MAARHFWPGALLFGLALGHPPALGAQGIEIAPFGGYRFGGGFFEVMANQPVDTDGAPSFGVLFDVPVSNGTAFEGLFTHQAATIVVGTRPSLPPQLWRISVEHWQAGGIQELDTGAVRPFLTGLLGLTRFAAPGDAEVRFTLGAGGGVKLFPVESVGVRLDGRVFATFVDADGSTIACAPGGCLMGLHVNVVWQAEFTAGLVFRIR